MIYGLKEGFLGIFLIVVGHDILKSPLLGISSFVSSSFPLILMRQPEVERRA